jgi:hypothetical protein
LLAIENVDSLQRVDGQERQYSSKRWRPEWFS